MFLLHICVSYPCYYIVATIECSCMSVCVCVLICEHDNLTMHGRKIMKFANTTEYENISDEFYPWQNFTKEM